MGSQKLSGFGGKLKREGFAVKIKSCYKKNFSAVDLIFTSRVTFRFEITIKRLPVRLMRKQRVTNLGSLKLDLPKSN